MSVVKTIDRVVSAEYAGPALTFNRLHVTMAIYLLGKEGALGREILSKRLGVGRGAVRTLIQRLKSEGLIRVEREGCRLSEKGRRIFLKIQERVPLLSMIDAGSLTADRYSCAVLVKKAGRRVKAGLEQRDSAVMAGAKGATTLIFRQGRYMMPQGSRDCERDYPDKVWSELTSTFHLEEEDVIVISSAPSELAAKYGALAAAWTFVES